MHIILDTINKDGDDLACLNQCKRTNVWDKFVEPNLDNKTMADGAMISVIRLALRHLSSYLHLDNFIDCLTLKWHFSFIISNTKKFLVAVRL